MTTPATCPHCGKKIAYKPAQHAAACPANPDNHAAYRAALEDPALPGVLRRKREYEENRGDLWSGTFLQRTWDCGWGDLAQRYGLELREKEPRRKIQWLDKTMKTEGPKIAATMQHNREITAPTREIGLPVLRYRDVQVGNVIRRIYTIR